MVSEGCVRQHFGESFGLAPVEARGHGALQGCRLVVAFMASSVTGWSTFTLRLTWMAMNAFSASPQKTVRRSAKGGGSGKTYSGGWRTPARQNREGHPAVNTVACGLARGRLLHDVLILARLGGQPFLNQSESGLIRFIVRGI
jgi:hypothetical protein